VRLVLDRPHSFLDTGVAVPAPPGVIDRLAEVLDSRRAGAAEIAAVLNADAVFASLLLLIVNSAYYDLPVPIKDVKHAVAYLGPAEIRRLSAAIAVLEGLRPDDATEFRRFWYHSFHTALTAKSIAARVARGMETDDLPVAALLHDVGKLVYLKFFPRDYARLSEFRNQNDLTIIDAEAYFALPSHTTLGARLCELWRLPDPVRQACLGHELPDLQRVLAGDDASEDLRVVCVANLLSNLCVEKLTPGLKTTIQNAASRVLGLVDEAEFLLLMGELYDLGSKVEAFVARL